MFITASAQTDSLQIQKSGLSEVFISIGQNLKSTTTGTLQDFRKLAPRSEILKNDFTGFHSNNGYITEMNTYFSIMAGINPKCCKTSNPGSSLLRVGINFGDGMRFSNYLDKSTRTAFDTLISGQTGEYYYRDSVLDEYCDMTYISQELNIEGSYIFRTSPERRWSFFAGFGVSGGFTFNNSVSINQYSYESRSIRLQNGDTFYENSYSYNENNSINEVFRLKSSFTTSFFLPLGVDFRIGKRRDFLKKFHLFYELRPGIQVRNIPELDTFTGISTVSCFGLRVTR